MLKSCDALLAKLKFWGEDKQTLARYRLLPCTSLSTIFLEEVQKVKT